MKSPWEFEVEQLLRDRARREADAGVQRVSLRGLVVAVCAACAVERQELASRSRHRAIVEARELLSHTAHEWFDVSYPEIAREIGRRSHSGVRDAALRFAGRPELDLAKAVGRVRDALPANVEVAALRGSARHGRGG